MFGPLFDSLHRPLRVQNIFARNEGCIRCITDITERVTPFLYERRGALTVYKSDLPLVGTLVRKGPAVSIFTRDVEQFHQRVLVPFIGR